MPTPHHPARTHSQLPAGEAIFLDHVGHFVAGADAASAALMRAGFAPTPVSVQVNPDPAGGPPKLTGTGNVCAMLRGGYIEVLFKTAETALGTELDTARRRYGGLHLIAFAIADAGASHGRLAGAGFPMQPVVRMQRPVETAEGPDIAAFEVVRVAPGTMPEGRVQVLRHLSERTVWQPRWLDHPNGARSLRALSIVVADPDEAAARFARFTGRSAQGSGGTRRIALDRGMLELLAVDDWRARWPEIEVPSLPFMGECAIEVTSLQATLRCVEAGGLTVLASGSGMAVRFPEALGHGVWRFVGAPLSEGLSHP